MGTISYSDAAFRALFPAYASTADYPQVLLQAYWDTATSYVSNVTGGCFTGGLTLAQQTLALNQMTAHLVYLAGLIAAGQNPGLETQATVDKISITQEPPPIKNQWQFWLNLTPYGQQLLALLHVASVGGYYVPGGLGRRGFGFGGGN